MTLKGNKLPGSTKTAKMLMDFARARNKFLKNKTDVNRHDFVKHRTKCNRVKSKAKQLYKNNEVKNLKT